MRLGTLHVTSRLSPCRHVRPGTLRCESGGVTHQHAPIGAAYDTFADDYADAFRGTEPEQPGELDMLTQFSTLVSTATAAVPGTRPPQILDAGCGAGRMLPLLARHGAQVLGVDVSAGMLDRARRDHPDFSVELADLTALPFEDGSFDGYFSWYSTIHLDDDALESALVEAVRVLRPGGLALLAFQTGAEVRDIGPGLRRFGHEVVLYRYHREVDVVGAALARTGVTEVARFRRGPVGTESDPQAVIIGRRD